MKTLVLTTSGVRTISDFGFGPTAANVHDIRNFGGVPNDPTKDVGPAFYAALDAWTSHNPIGGLSDTTTQGGIYFPEGTYYTSMPLCTFGACQLWGDGTNLSVISVGTGGPSTPANTSSFAGTVIYIAAPYDDTHAGDPVNLPAFTSSPVSGGGQALLIPDADNVTSPLFYPLHDAWAWCQWLGQDIRATAFSIQFWFRPDPQDLTTSFSQGVIGSRGPDRDRLGVPSTDIGWGVYVTSSDAVNIQFTAYLTTNPAWTSSFAMVNSGTQVSITSSNLTPGTWYNVELDYDGGHFDLFVNGVSQGHIPAAGPVVRNPWEGVFIGGQGPEFLRFGSVPPCKGAFASLRLSNVARHTGTGSFSPPAAQYAWDANTYALYNFDIPMKEVPVEDNTFRLPFLMGQTYGGTSFGFGTADAPVPHYIRLIGSAPSPDGWYHDFTIQTNNSACGLVASNSWRTFLQRVNCSGGTQFGLRIATDVSFFSQLEDCNVVDVYGTGISMFGQAYRLQTIACGIGLHAWGGSLVAGMLHQGVYNSFICFLFGGSEGGVVETFDLTGVGNDAEVWNFSRQKSVGAFFGNGGTILSKGNLWDARLSPGPPVIYFKTPAMRATATHTGDSFIPNFAGSGLSTPPVCAGIAFLGTGAPANKVTVIDPMVWDRNPTPLPFSNRPEWVSTITGDGTTNQRGISTSETQAQNLAGTFTILHGYTYGGPDFLNPEPDANYDVTITPKSHLGSAPAVGSNRITGYEARQDGFTASVEVDPGGTCEMTYSWHLIRTQPPPLYFDYTPAIPSSFTNPLGGLTNTPFAFGVTLVPVANQLVFPYTQSLANQAILSGGAPPAADAVEIGIDNSDNWIENYIGTTHGQFFEPFVVNGHLCSVASPGSHNVVSYFDGAGQFLYVDGRPKGPSAVSYGVMPSTLHVGERADTTRPLTTATIRNLKVDTIPTRALSTGNDIGPGTMDQAAFVGDDWVRGQNATLATGGWAQQIATNRYGTTFYHMAAYVLSGHLTTITNEGIVVNLWAPWQGVAGAPPLTGLCIMAGWRDLFQFNKTAAEVFAALKSIVEGSAASATWDPPTSDTTPTDQHAWALIYPGTGTASLTINGRPFSSVFSVDGNTTANNLIAAMAADGPTNALFVGLNIVDPNTGLHLVKVQVGAPGTAGNVYVCTSDGGGGSVCFGQVSGIPQTALSVTTLGGIDTTVVINGISFPANFDTDANTTVNNLIARIAADPTTNALVTGTNVAGTMLVTANADGYAGNVPIGGVPTNIPSAVWYTQETLRGGFNGAIQNGTPAIVVCNIPPQGTSPFFSAPAEVQRVALNALINAYAPDPSVTIADVDTLLKDGGTPQNLNPLYDSGDGHLNDAGHTAVFGLIDPLLP